MRPSPFSLGALALVLTAGPLGAYQQADPVAGGATFLLIPIGGRAAALGQAAVADGGTSEAAFWNPAGLALLTRSEFAVHHGITFVSNNTAISGFFTANRLGVIGVTGYLVDFGEQEVVTGPGLPVGRIAPKNVEILASYATTIAGDLTFGLNYKLIQFRQDCTGECGPFRDVVGTTHGVDVGLQYAFGHDDALRVGLAIRHAGFKLQLENRDQADPLPTRVQIGASYRMALPRPAGADEGLDARVLVDLQDAWGRYDNPDARVGLDVGYREVIRVRAGYAFLRSENSGPSVGLGLQLGRLGLDFARIFFDSSNFDEPVHFSLRVGL